MPKSLVLLLFVVFGASLNAQEKPDWELRFEGNMAVTVSTLDMVFRQCDENSDFHRTDFADYEHCFEKSKYVFWKKGHLKAQLDSVSFRQDGRGLLVELVIYEGPAFRYEGLAFESEFATKSIWDHIDKIIPMKPGEVAMVDERAFSHDAMGLDIVPEYDDFFGSVKFRILLSRLSDYNYSRVEFIGNEVTRYRKISRHMKYGEGDLFSVERVKADIWRVNNAGVMQPIDPEKDVEIYYDHKLKSADVSIRMKEK